MLTVKVTLDTSTSVDLFRAVCGIYYAILEKGVKVVNLSWGYYDTIPADILAGLLDLTLSENVLLVAGAGNDNRDLSGAVKFYPADLSDSIYSVGRQTVIKVGAHDSTGLFLAPFSNYPVEIVAPGVDVISTAIVGTSDTITAKASGTSYATPYVTRRAAIIRGLNPTMAAADIKEAVLSLTVPISSGKSQDWPIALKLILKDTIL